VITTVDTTPTIRGGIRTTLQVTGVPGTTASHTTAPTTAAPLTTTGRVDRVGIAATEPMNNAVMKTREHAGIA